MMVVDEFRMPPNVCFYCRSVSFPGLDLERDDEDNPNKIEHVYLCRDCLMHAARIVLPRCGLAVVADAAMVSLEGELKALRVELDQARAEVAMALRARDALVESYGREPLAAVGDVPAVVEQRKSALRGQGRKVDSHA
jgi:hypothetical protein